MTIPTHWPAGVHRPVGPEHWWSDPSAAAAAMTVEDLADMSLSQLEQVWSELPCAPLPTGLWQGAYLAELPMSRPKRFLARALFKRRLFGINLDAHKWWFRDASSTLVEFAPRPGNSRWREADVIQLHYERTGPILFRTMLYDELKPLNENCILGLGGSNHDDARGTWFFFTLSRVPIL